MNPALLSDLARRWRWRTLTRDALRIFGAVALGVGMTLPWTRSAPWGALFTVSAVALFVSLRASRPWRIGPERVAAHLDRTYPELEESARLWLSPPGSLTIPERLQLQRLAAAWADLDARGMQPGGAPAGFWGWPLAIFSAGLVTFGSGMFWRGTHPRPAETMASHDTPVASPVNAPTPPAASPRPVLTGVELTVVPPAYTARTRRVLAGLDADVEEGATVTWRLTLRGPPVREVKIGFGESVTGEELPLRETAPGSSWEGSRVVGAESGLYHVEVRPTEGPVWRLPEIGSLKVIPDAPPVVSILRPADPRTVLDPDAPGLPVEAVVTDDYGVTGARLVATVAKGSGEAVKFRERTLEFDPPMGEGDRTGRRERRFVTTLDLAALGLESGDELYFYVVAEDNHPPAAHRTRSETRFVALRGPADTPATTGVGRMGVNLVPEYFRSQRQLILDTERLLAERRDGLSERDFHRRANDLGADQSLLRLRYGQFVGEEQSAGVGDAGDHAEVSLSPLRPGVPVGVPGDLVHQHDAAGAGDGLVVNDPRAGLRTAMRLRLEHADEARGVGDGHGHDAPGVPDRGTAPTAGQIVAPFVDQHDSQDAATFFDQGTKATLRGVLAEMWQAEGLLRAARPEEALAPEQRALEGLKELQQGERLYVQRVGFEPAPLRESERRGRGDVETVPERRLAGPTPPPGDDAKLAGVRSALAALPGGAGGVRPLTPAQRSALGGAATPLGEAAARRGDEFLAGLRALRRLESAERTPAEPGDLAALRAALLRLLPPAEERPARPVLGLLPAETRVPAEGGSQTP